MRQGSADGLLQAMRCVAATVTVVASRHPQTDEPTAMTATSFVSTALEPPTVHIAVNDKASLASCLEMGRHFSVQILGDGQNNRQLAEVCSDSEREGERFTLAGWDFDASTRVPLWTDAMAVIIAKVTAKEKIGTHWAIFGQVCHAERAKAGDASPLIYCGGHYHSLL